MTELSCAAFPSAAWGQNRSIDLAITSAPRARAQLTLERLQPRRLALTAGTAIAILGALGALHALGRGDGPGARLDGFGLDQEWSVPAVFSGALLFAAAAGCRLVAAAGGLPRVRTGALVGLGALFAFMGADEILQFHERLEQVAGEGWQRLYAPLVVVAAVLWLAVLRGLLVRAAAAALFCGGAAAWTLAQLFEHVQRDGAVLLHRWTILPEEILEMTGSALLGLGLLVGAQAAAGHRLRA